MQTTVQRMHRRKPYGSAYGAYGADASAYVAAGASVFTGIVNLVGTVKGAKIQEGINQTNLDLANFGLQGQKEVTKQTAMQLEAARIAAAAAGKAPIQGPPAPEKEESNVVLYAVLGVGALALLGGGAFLLTRKKA
jgi:LPXTG-motif cell wall-anchored protein